MAETFLKKVTFADSLIYKVKSKTELYGQIETFITAAENTITASQNSLTNFKKIPSPHRGPTLKVLAERKSRSFKKKKQQVKTAIAKNEKNNEKNKKNNEKN